MRKPHGPHGEDRNRITEKAPPRIRRRPEADRRRAGTKSVNAAEHQRLTRLFDTVSAVGRIGGWELDLPSRRLVWSPELYRIHDIAPGAAVNLDTALNGYPAEFRRLLHHSMVEAMETGRCFVHELPLITAAGNLKWVRVTGEAELAGDVPIRLVGTVQDISDLRQRERLLERLAKHDDLTGLPNRKLFFDDLELAIRAAAANGTKLALMVINLDNFKAVNDTFGHDCGDRLLVEFVRRLKLCFRAEDTIARLGGDEFAAALPDLPDTKALNSIAQRIRIESSGAFATDGEAVDISASMGSAIYPDHAGDAAALLKQADIALCAAKATGRARHHLYDPTMGEELALTRRTLTALRGAIANREIVPFYQPIVRASDRRPVALEALVRWARGDGQIIPPPLFMAALADPALSSMNGEIMIASVAGQIAAWRDEGLPPVTVSVNVAADQMARVDFAPALLNILSAYGVAPTSLAIEITEGVLLSQNRHHLIATFEALTEAGVLIDFDDFGTGYASLTHLKEFPVHRIKIDRTFIAQLPGDRESLGIVRAVISLAHDLSKQVIAEGVETDDQAELLAELGCDFLQGYLFARPLPPAEASEYLRRHAGPPAAQQAAPASVVKFRARAR